MAFLIGLLFQIFVTIGRIAVFIQLQRTVHNEIIYTSQTIQNLVDNQEISLTGYNLVDDAVFWWRKDALEFTDWTLNYEIKKYSTGTKSYLRMAVCDLVCDPWPSWIDPRQYYQITDPERTRLESFLVKTLPYGNDSDYFQLLHNGFWMLVDLRASQYDDNKRYFRVFQQIQLFFSMRKYE